MLLQASRLCEFSVIRTARKVLRMDFLMPNQLLFPVNWLLHTIHPKIKSIGNIVWAESPFTKCKQNTWIITNKGGARISTEQYSKIERKCNDFINDFKHI